MRISLLVLFCVLGYLGFGQNNVAMEDLESTDSGLIYKSPVKEGLNVNMPNKEHYRVSVFNSFGEKQIYIEDASESVMLDVIGLKPGSYFVIMKSDTTSKAFKFRKV